jgi:hypothetical protein
MDDNELFEKYWKEFLFIDMPYIIPTERDKNDVIQSYGFARYKIFIAVEELKEAIIGSLPKWLRKWIT